MGVVPLTWAEIQAWLNCTSLSLSTWEITTIKDLSEAYASEFSQASDKFREQPYLHVAQDVDIKTNRDTVQNKLASAFAALKKR